MVSEGRGERVRNVGWDCRAAKLERRSEDSQASAEGKKDESSIPAGCPRPLRIRPGETRLGHAAKELTGFPPRIDRIFPTATLTRD